MWKISSIWGGIFSKIHSNTKTNRFIASHCNVNNNFSRFYCKPRILRDISISIFTWILRLLFCLGVSWILDFRGCQHSLLWVCRSWGNFHVKKEAPQNLNSGGCFVVIFGVCHLHNNYTIQIWLHRRLAIFWSICIDIFDPERDFNF